MSRDALWWGGAAVAATALLAVYLVAAFRLPGAADVTAASSGIFDMDVSRVVADLTGDGPAWRASVHPLQKLLVSPLGRAANAAFFDGRDPLGAARVLIACFTALQALACGALAWQLAGRRAGAGLAALLLCGFSFASFLAASIPESAAVAAPAAVLPLLFLNARWGRRFGAAEACAWGALGALAFGLTVTQLAHCGIALGVRVGPGREAAADGGAPPRRAAPWLALAAAVFAALLFAGLRAQAARYPSPPPKPGSHPLAAELHFLRLGRLAATPVRHGAEVLAHFAVIDFVAPAPGHSDFLIRDYGLGYWSLSLEDAGPEQWSGARRTLALAVLVAVGIAAAGLRGAGARFVAPALCVAAQFVLHLLYGREYVLYAPHWHAVWVALLVAAAWRAHPRRGPVLLAVSGLLAAALLANDVAVMREVYREVEAGLGVHLRGPDGALPAPD